MPALSAEAASQEKASGPAKRPSRALQKKASRPIGFGLPNPRHRRRLGRGPCREGAEGA